MKHNIIIVGIGSDIGYELAKRYSKLKYDIIGTYKSQQDSDKLSKINNCQYYNCDINNTKDIVNFKNYVSKKNIGWDLFISSIGTQKPINKFFECDFNEWSKSIHINAIEQLRMLHNLYPYRNKNEVVDVVFFAGSGTNGVSPNYSAYTISKIMLIKMCELLDNEYDDINIFIIGPGWVRTKIHQETINSIECAGDNFYRTLRFVEGDGISTAYDDIFDCIEWARSKERKIVGGRNFSVVNDKWKEDKITNTLSELLLCDNSMYKLRRHKNGEI